MTDEIAEAIERYNKLKPLETELRGLAFTPLGLGGQNTKFLTVSTSGPWLVKFCRNNEGRCPEVCVTSFDFLYQMLRRLG
jgi:hypothetical protein